MADEIEGLGEIEAEEKSKKDQVLELYASGVREIADIVRRVKARPSYVAHVLQQAGHLVDDGVDLYEISAGLAGVYTRYFRNVLKYTTRAEAEESCRQLTRLYDYFERLGDRQGQHRACVVALTGKNRARWSGRPAVAEIFAEWLQRH